MAKRKEITFEINENGCHICTSHSPDKRGYTNYNYDGKRSRLHRYIYEQNFGKIPEGLLVRHKCDNKRCINPEHLELGDFHDNMMDMATRQGFDMYFFAKGEKHWKRKLTEDQVREIRKSEMGCRKLAKLFNVSCKNIQYIRTYKSWKHVS